MTSDIPELQRRVSNVFRIGNISAVDLAAARVKVDFQGVTTAWIPWMTDRAGAVKIWNPPSVGEQVCVCSPSGELGAGFIMSGAINYAGNPASDNRNHVYRLELPASGAFEIKIGDRTFILNNTKLVFDGDLEVDGDIKATGNVIADGDITAGTVSLSSHVHAGVVAGPASTAPPTP